jgi:hypothetical protein
MHHTGSPLATNGIIQHPPSQDAPDPPPKAPPGIGALAEELIGWLKWGALVAGVIGMLICAGMIVVGRRRRGRLAHDGLIGSAWVLGGLALASTAALLVGTFASIGAP